MEAIAPLKHAMFAILAVFQLQDGDGLHFGVNQPIFGDLDVGVLAAFVDGVPLSVLKAGADHFDNEPGRWHLAGDGVASLQ